MFNKRNVRILGAFLFVVLLGTATFAFTSGDFLQGKFKFSSHGKSKGASLTLVPTAETVNLQGYTTNASQRNISYGDDVIVYKLTLAADDDFMANEIKVQFLASGLERDYLTDASYWTVETVDGTEIGKGCGDHANTITFCMYNPDKGTAYPYLGDNSVNWLVFKTKVEDDGVSNTNSLEVEVTNISWWAGSNSKKSISQTGTKYSEGDASGFPTASITSN